MPLTKSAKRALRVSRRRRVINLKAVTAYKKALKVGGEKSSNSLRRAYSALDVAAKKGVIHPKKAARLKGRLAKLVKLKTLTLKRVKKLKK